MVYLYDYYSSLMYNYLIIVLMYIYLIIVKWLLQ